MANSSMFVLPRMMTPASRSRLVTVASYGGRQPSRILEPQVVGMSAVVMTSLSASGTPASRPSGSPAARLRSTARAAATAPSAATCRNACTWGSTAAIRSRCAWVTSTADTSPLATAAAIWAAVSRVSSPAESAAMSVLRQDARDAEPALLGEGCAGQRLVLGQARQEDVVTEHVDDRNRVSHRRDPLGRDLLHPRHCADDLVKLAGKMIELSVTQGQPGEPGQVRDLVPGDGHERHPMGPARGQPKPLAPGAASRSTRPAAGPSQVTMAQRTEQLAFR